MIEGRKTAKAKVRLQSFDKKKEKAIIEVVIHEGRNRQVRKMFDTIGHPVQKLSREAYAFLDLKGLNAGERRELTHHEVKRLKAYTQFGDKK